MKRVLVVAYFFPPLGGGGVPRPLSWARWLPEHGWDVTVLCAGPAGSWVQDESLAALVPAATEVLRVDAPTAVALWKRHLAGRSGVRQEARDDRLRALARFLLLPDSYRAWTAPAVAAGRARLARGDIRAVLSTSPPETAHRVGEALARSGAGAALPWLADFRDPWVGLHYRKPPTPWHAWWHRRAERRVLAGADRVLCASRTHAARVEAALGAAAEGRVRFLPNGIADGPAAEAPAPGAPATGDPARARIVYTGTLVETPAMAAFLAALADEVRDRPDLARQVELVLAGPHEAGYATRIRELGLAQVARLTGPLPHAEARRLQRGAAALLLVRNEGRGYDAMIPGKLYEYLDARRPLVAMVGESEAAELARSCGALVFAPADGAGAARAALAAALGGPEGPAPDLPRIAALLATRSRRALAGELAAILDEVTVEPPAAR